MMQSICCGTKVLIVSLLHWSVSFEVVYTSELVMQPSANYYYVATNAIT